MRDLKVRRPHPRASVPLDLGSDHIPLALVPPDVGQNPLVPCFANSAAPVEALKIVDANHQHNLIPDVRQGIPVGLGVNFCHISYFLSETEI